MMFQDPNDPFRERDHCEVCRWHGTTACPRNLDYVGRIMRDPDVYYKYGEICHRYVLTATEQEWREEQIMTKLQENLEIDDGGNIPF